MKSVFLFLGILLMHLHAAAQNGTGTVTALSDNTPLQGASVYISELNASYITDKDGRFSFKLPKDSFTVEVKFLGFTTVVKRFAPQSSNIYIALEESQLVLKDVVVTGYAKVGKRNMTASVVVRKPTAAKREQNFQVQHMEMAASAPNGIIQDVNTDEFTNVKENKYKTAATEPLSTFSADVDRASYSLVRRALDDGELPYTDAVRVEELINYFDYSYAGPADNAPVAVHTDLAVCPWQPQHQLVRIGIQGKRIPADNLPASNLVFLLDVSGSMGEPNKLPLLKQAFKVLVQQLRPQDRVAIVVYAGAAGLVLPSTPGNEKTKIMDALEKLESGGSTAGGAGIQLAYKTAKQHFIKKGNNRVILATDGDFNVGISSDDDLEEMIAKERASNIFLSVLGFGMGNYKDNHLETLADKGNGNYAYIDDFEEARRTFATEFGGTLFTIAKDVKLQVEFNPALVKSYRLVGYESRLLANEDFNDDKKDAGDIGSGHTVTALYEIVPAGSLELPGGPTVDPLKYQSPVSAATGIKDELLTVKVRYKAPDGDKSSLLSKVLKPGARDIKNCPADFRLAASVAAFGMLLRESPHAGSATFDQALELAVSAKGDDPEGYRAEYIQLVKKAKALKSNIKDLSKK